MKIDIVGLDNRVQDVDAKIQEIKIDHNGMNQTYLSFVMLISRFAGAAELKHKINQWLGALDPSSNHNTAYQKQQPRTGMVHGERNIRGLENRTKRVFLASWHP